MKIETHTLIFYKIPWSIFIILGMSIPIFKFFNLNIYMISLILLVIIFDFLFAMLAGVTFKATCPKCKCKCSCNMTWQGGVFNYKCDKCSFSENINVLK